MKRGIWWGICTLYIAHSAWGEVFPYNSASFAGETWVLWVYKGVSLIYSIEEINYSTFYVHSIKYIKKFIHKKTSKTCMYRRLR